MKILNKEDRIELKAGSRIFEGIYKGRDQSNLYVKVDEKGLKFPIDKIDYVKSADEYRTISEEIKRFKDLMENRIPNNPQTLVVDANPYQLYRLILKITGGENYNPDTSGYGYGASLLMSYNPEEHESLKKEIKKHGHTFKELNADEPYTEEDHEPNNTSPYPKNVHDD